MKEAMIYLNEKLCDNDIVVIALSGGPDSMALSDLLLKVRKKIKIVVAHVHHNLRKESDYEKLFVEEYCNRNNLIFEYFRIDGYKNDKFSENEARIKRYNFFKKIIKKYAAKYLLTAHHGDDLVETILMRLSRGSTLKGYSGFSKESTCDTYQILRPLISATKEDIMAYLELNNLEYVIDKTNTDINYTRNRYRTNMLPFFKQENKNIHLKFIKYSELLKSYDDYLNDNCKLFINEMYSDGKIEIAKFEKLKNIEKIKFINIILEKIYADNLYLINDKHVDSIIGLLKKGYKINLPLGFHVVKEYGFLKFLKDYKKDDYCIEINKNLILPNGHQILIVTSEESDSNFVCRLSKEEINFPIYVRNRRVGDKMLVKNLNGTQSISNIFTNAKLEKNYRDNYPIVIDSNDQIIWIPGVKKSKFDRTKYEKYDIILKYR